MQKYSILLCLKDRKSGLQRLRVSHYIKSKIQLLHMEVRSDKVIKFLYLIQKK